MKRVHVRGIRRVRHVGRLARRDFVLPRGEEPRLRFCMSSFWIDWAQFSASSDLHRFLDRNFAVIILGRGSS